MNEKVVYLYPNALEEPIGHYLRIGTSGHRQLEVLLGSGRSQIDRAVIDASTTVRQRDLIASLSKSGAELVLDTNIAELSVLGRYSGIARSAPWANPHAVLTADDLRPSANRDLIGEIARFAVSGGYSAVLAPSHLLLNSADPLFKVDLQSASALRRALDKEGGKQVGIDYPLIISYASLRDPAQSRAFISGLADSPFTNLWLRVSGFGADATAIGSARYISAVIDFHRLKRPIVADEVGGLAGLATIAFGAVGGICHGIAEKERFDASNWNKPRQSKGGGGEKRILVDSLDKLLSAEQIALLMATPGARRMFSCNNRSCCPRGLDDTMKHSKAHYLHQRHLQISELSRVPAQRRAEHFLEKQLSPARKHAHQATQLEIEDHSFSKTLRKNSDRLDKMYDVLKNLLNVLSKNDRSTSPKKRQKPSDFNAEQRGG